MTSQAQITPFGEARWSLEGDSIVLRNVRFQNGVEYDYRIRRPHSMVPSDFTMSLNNLVLLQEKLNELFADYPDPSKVQMSYKRLPERLIVNVKQQGATDCTANPSMLNAAQRIHDITRPALRGVFSTTSQKIVHPESVNSTWSSEEIAAGDDNNEGGFDLNASNASVPSRTPAASPVAARVGNEDEAEMEVDANSSEEGVDIGNSEEEMDDASGSPAAAAPIAAPSSRSVPAVQTGPSPAGSASAMMPEAGSLKTDESDGSEEEVETGSDAEEPINATSPAATVNPDEIGEPDESDSDSHVEPDFRPTTAPSLAGPVVSAAPQTHRSWKTLAECLDAMGGTYLGVVKYSGLQKDKTQTSYTHFRNLVNGNASATGSSAAPMRVWLKYLQKIAVEHYYVTNDLVKEDMPQEHLTDWLKWDNTTRNRYRYWLAMYNIINGLAEDRMNTERLVEELSKTTNSYSTTAQQPAAAPPRRGWLNTLTLGFLGR